MKIKVSDLKFGLLFTLIVFNNIIIQYSSTFSYLDEVICVWALLSIVLHSKAKVFKKKYAKIIASVLGMLLLGLAANIIYSYHAANIAIMKDIIAFVKFPIVAVAAMMWQDRNVSDAPRNVAVVLSKIYITVIAILGAVSLYVDIGMSYDLRNGIFSYMFLFAHPTFLVYSLVLMSVVVVASGLEKKDYFYIIEVIFLMIVSMRDKGFAYAVLLVVFIFLLPNIKRIKIHYIIIVAVALVAISYNKILEYMSWSWSPRFALYSTAIEILKDCFPLGSGFGTFGNSISGEYYATTYYIYGFSTKQGINPENYVDLGDAGWAYLAQFGVIGLSLFIFIGYLLFKNIKQRYAADPWKLKAGYLLAGYLVIASLVENVFSNESGATSVLVLFMFTGSCVTGELVKTQNPRGEICDGVV